MSSPEAIAVPPVLASSLVVSRLLLSVSLLAISAWVVAWRRARPDLAPRWLAWMFTILPVAIALAALSTATSHPFVAAGARWIAACTSAAIAFRLWTTHRWLARRLTPDAAAREARRLADDAIDMTSVAEETARKRGEKP